MHLFLIEEPECFVKWSADGKTPKMEMSDKALEEFKKLYQSFQVVGLVGFYDSAQIGDFTRADIVRQSIFGHFWQCLPKFYYHAPTKVFGFEDLQNLLTRQGVKVYSPRNPSTVKTNLVYKFLEPGTFTRINLASFGIEKDRESSFAELAAQRELNSCF